MDSNKFKVFPKTVDKALWFVCFSKDIVQCLKFLQNAFVYTLDIEILSSRIVRNHIQADEISVRLNMQYLILTSIKHAYQSLPV